MKRILPLLIGLALLAAVSAGLRLKSRPAAVVLYDQATPKLVPVLPDACCSFIPLQGFRPDGRKAETVILSGHGLPPMYAGEEAREVAHIVASFHPSLVIINSCYGASAPLLDALAAEDLRSYVVAGPYLLPVPGLVIEPDFLKYTDPAQRAMRVRTEPPYPLLRWQLDPARLKAIHARVDAMPAAELKRRLKRVMPSLVKIELPTSLDPGGRVLVPVAPERLK